MNSYGDSHLENYEIMSASEREQAEPAHSERRMPIMNEVHDITFINLFFLKQGLYFIHDNRMLAERAFYCW